MDYAGYQRQDVEDSSQRYPESLLVRPLIGSQPERMIVLRARLRRRVHGSSEYFYDLKRCPVPAAFPPVLMYLCSLLTYPFHMIVLG